MTRPGWISKLNVAYKLNQWNFNLNMTPRPANVTTPNQLYTMSFNTRLLNPSGLGVNPARQFGRAKLAQMMYIKNLALRMRDSNLAAIAVCPGKKNLYLLEISSISNKVQPVFYQPQGWSTCAAGRIKTRRGDIQLF